jgi:hypothetical protein
MVPRRERDRDHDIACAGGHTDPVRDVGDAEPTHRGEEGPEYEGPCGPGVDSSGENFGPAVCEGNYLVVRAYFEKSVRTAGKTSRWGQRDRQWRRLERGHHDLDPPDLIICSDAFTGLLNRRLV